MGWDMTLLSALLHGRQRKIWEIAYVDNWIFDTKTIGENPYYLVLFLLDNIFWSIFIFERRINPPPLSLFQKPTNLPWQNSSTSGQTETSALNQNRNLPPPPSLPGENLLPPFYNPRGEIHKSIKFQFLKSDNPVHFWGQFVFVWESDGAVFGLSLLKELPFQWRHLTHFWRILFIL